MPTTLGAHSPKIAAVRELLSKKGRREQRRFTFEGPTMLREALAGGVAIEAVFVTQGAAQQLPPTGAAGVFIVADAAMKRISDVETPSGIVAVAHIALAQLDDLLETDGPLLYLAGVADPGNAGTLMRSAEAFGASGVIFGEGAVDPYNPKVVRGSMGSIFRMPVCIGNGSDVVERAHVRQWKVVASAASGVPIETFIFPPRAIYAIGNERRGTTAALPAADATLAITQIGASESLNAAVAGSIVLYEATRKARVRP